MHSPCGCVWVRDRVRTQGEVTHTSTQSVMSQLQHRTYWCIFRHRSSSMITLLSVRSPFRARDASIRTMLKFRYIQQYYAVIADIEFMYHTVKISVPDRDVLGFLCKTMMVRLDDTVCHHTYLMAYGVPRIHYNKLQITAPILQ